jgi:hypothetical protein
MLPSEYFHSSRSSFVRMESDRCSVESVNRQGTPVPADILLDLSPLGWEHINLTGDYVWDLRQTRTLQRLRPLRRGALSVQTELQSKVG